MESQNWKVDLKWNLKLNHQSAQALYPDLPLPPWQHHGKMLRPKVKPSKTRIVNVLYAKKAVCGCRSINQFIISELISQDFVSDYLWLVFGVVCTLANLTKKMVGKNNQKLPYLKQKTFFKRMRYFSNFDIQYRVNVSIIRIRIFLIPYVQFRKAYSVDSIKHTVLLKVLSLLSVLFSTVYTKYIQYF